MKDPLIANDAAVIALLAVTLASILKAASSEHIFFKRFFTYIPSLLLCYFVPALYNSLGIIDGKTVAISGVASQYFLPASLALLTLSVDIKGIINLGPKVAIMFAAGTIGIIIGGPIALYAGHLIMPETINNLGGPELWRGFSTLAGGWIGGGVNQAAMYEVFSPPPNLYAALITVDIIIANIWIGVLIWCAGRCRQIDRWLQADTTAIDNLKERMESYQASITRTPTVVDFAMIFAVAFGITGLAHLAGNSIGPWIGENLPRLKSLSLDSVFLWVVTIVTLIGLVASFTPLRKLEGVGASKVGTLFLYILIMTIGLKMDLRAVLDTPGLLLIGIIWMSVHIILVIGTGRFLKVPMFFYAIGSQGNIGGAASATVLANAFHPSLVPVGILLSVFSYAMGNYAAILCAYLTRYASSLIW